MGIHFSILVGLAAAAAAGESGGADGNMIHQQAQPVAADADAAPMAVDNARKAGRPVISNRISDAELRSTNSGSVTSIGYFSDGAVIRGGEYNTMSVTAIGASSSAGNVMVNRQGDSVKASSALTDNTLSSNNSGNVRASGTFAGGRIQSGNRNSLSVQAVGASSTLTNSNK
ncbi:MAG: hypothetical protein ACNA7G_12595 [Methylobacter sp.]